MCKVPYMEEKKRVSCGESKYIFDWIWLINIVGKNSRGSNSVSYIASEHDANYCSTNIWNAVEPSAFNN